MRSHQNTDSTSHRLALGLGWFSVGLGLAELTAPRSVARLIGVPENDRTTATLQACGAREIANGLAILAQPDRPTWLWTRVGGDAVDVSSLAAELNANTSDRGRVTAALTTLLGVTALDVICARWLDEFNGRSSRRSAELATALRGGVRVERVTTINRPLEEVYAFWRNFENFPRFMRHLESVRVTGDGRSHWRAKGPAGMTVEWDAEIIEERENERISWKSLEGAEVENSGTVRFQHAPGARGTEVRVQLQYRPPAGRLGRIVASLFGEEPGQQIHEDLRRFKQLMETGEIPLSDGPGLWRPAHSEDLRSFAGVAR